MILCKSFDNIHILTDNTPVILTNGPSHAISIHSIHLLPLFLRINKLEFNVPFQHKYGYIRDEKSGVESYPYSIKEGQRFINLNPGRLFVQQPPKKGKEIEMLI